MTRPVATVPSSSRARSCLVLPTALDGVGVCGELLRPLEVTMQVQAGGHVIVESRKVGEHRRAGEVVEVLKAPGSEHYRVRWDDSHETIFFPSSDASIEHAGAPT